MKSIMTPALLISPDNFEYRGEGNASLVIKLKKEGKILRLSKHENLSQVKISIDEVLNELENQVEVAKNVMKHLLGEDIIYCPVIVPMKVEEIKTINNSCNHLRPAHRSHKSVYQRDTYGLTLPDYCSLPLSLSGYPSIGPVIAVEIKPKQGFMPVDGFFQSLQTSKPLMCRFCMMQYHKMRKGVIPKRSGYCPLDLFSGCPIRMLHALKSLFDAPQNNFRIFKDQSIVYSEENRGEPADIFNGFFDFYKEHINPEMFCNLIVKALLNSFPPPSPCKPSTSRNGTKKCVNENQGCNPKGLCRHYLPSGCVLDRVLSIQLLDNLNIMDIHTLFLELKNLDQRKAPNYIGCLPISEKPDFLGESEKNKAESRYHFVSRKVWEFLIALTLKDCSLMLVFKRLAPSFNSKLKQNMILDDNGNSYLFSVAIADLDCKSVNKVETVFQNTHQIFKSYIDSTSEEHGSNT